MNIITGCHVGATLIPNHSTNTSLFSKKYIEGHTVLYRGGKLSLLLKFSEFLFPTRGVERIIKYDSLRVQEHKCQSN